MDGMDDMAWIFLKKPTKVESLESHKAGASTQKGRELGNEIGVKTVSTT